jgi:hypothetical protein
LQGRPPADEFAVVFRKIEQLNASDLLRVFRPHGAHVDVDGFGDAVQVERNAMHGIHNKRACH